MAEARYQMEIEALDLGAGARAVGCELIEPATREPATGREAAAVWAATLVALAGGESWSLDFFAHLRRVRDFCSEHSVAFRDPNRHVLVVPAPASDKLVALFERFAGSTFGARAGGPTAQVDAAVEGGLAARGVDAYQEAFANYLFCAVCDFENGFLTLLSERMWASEAIRRARPALELLHVEVTRPA